MEPFVKQWGEAFRPTTHAADSVKGIRSRFKTVVGQPFQADSMKNRRDFSIRVRLKA